ncbi:MAG: GntR family transcriptional regulator, partial [Actinomycetota bacterium]
MREIRYRTIADELRRRVNEAVYAAGQLLPSENDLGAEFAASRVTVRRALETLRDEGLVDARQGFGWFVAAAPLRQSLGRLATIEAQLVDGGIRPQRRILEFAFEKASHHVRSVLG